MEKFFDILKSVSLFHGIDPADYPRMLACLNASPRHFLAGEWILLAGAPADRVGILLEGRAQVVREELSGSRTILTGLEPADLFAEAFVCASGGNRTLPVSVFSVTDSAVLLLDYRRIISSGPESCAFHDQLVENMLAVMAGKNLMLNRRIGHLSRRTTREKLLSYLSEQAAFCGSTEFDISFDRQELADYLCVERSAMSAILSKLRAQGVLEYSRSHFRLLALPKEHVEEAFYSD